MSDDLVKHLRNSKGWPTLGNAAADRIEELSNCLEHSALRVAVLEAKLTWQPIETAPNEEGVLHVRGLWVYGHPQGIPLYFDACAGFLRDGVFVTASGEDFGWRPEDYTHWMPLDAPPSQN